MKITNNIHEGFSEEFLSKYITCSSDGNYIIGGFFEELTRELFSGYAERLSTNSHCDICPDLREIKRREFFIECKAAKIRTYSKRSVSKKAEWKMRLSGIDNYSSFLNSYFPDVSLENPDFKPSLLYAFWTYDTGEKKIEDFKVSSELIEGLSCSNIKLYLIDSFILDSMCKLKEMKSPQSYGDIYRFWSSDFKLLDNDEGLIDFIKKWELPTGEDRCVYSSCKKSGLVINEKQVNSFPVRVLLSKESYNKESITNFLESNIL